MPTFANAQATQLSGGAPYCLNHLMPAAEGSLSDAPAYQGDPVPLPFEQAIAAEVAFAAQGSPSGVSVCYVVLQVDNGDGNWVDACWCNLTAVPGASPTVFWLSVGLDAVNGVFQQARAVGTTPTPSNSSNPIALGARMRFVGKCTLTASSSSSSSSSAGPGVTPGILVTIRYRPVSPR